MQLEAIQTYNQMETYAEKRPKRYTLETDALAMAFQVNICSKVTIILIYISILNFSDYYTTMPPPGRLPPPHSLSRLAPLTIRNPPRLERQRLQFYRGRLDELPKGEHAYDHTDDVRNIVSISIYVADAASLDTAILFGRESAGEGVCDERSAEVGGKGGSWGRRDARCDGKEIDELEDEEAREGAAKIRDTISFR
jgi:hypothetical protein